MCLNKLKPKRTFILLLYCIHLNSLRQKYIHGIIGIRREFIIRSPGSSSFGIRNDTTISATLMECMRISSSIYVEETKGELRKRMNGHRSSINTGGNQFLYKHYNLPDFSDLSLKVRILEKVYYQTNRPNLSTPFRRKREEHLIRQLGIAAPYGCNLCSSVCQSVNVLIKSV